MNLNVTLDTSRRSNLPEIMDDFEMEGAQLRETLDKIASINRLLGGNSVTFSGVAELLSIQTKTEKITILDAGCGGGDLLRELSRWGRKRNLDFHLIGIDANTDAVRYAREQSVDFPEISYLTADLFSTDIQQWQPDIILTTLTLHHFSDEDILKLLVNFRKAARIGIVINDLQRSALAFRLFQVVSFVFRLPEMPSYDGLVSILRGFKRSELRTFSEKLNLKTYSIRWKWAFRFQWIIQNA